MEFIDLKTQYEQLKPAIQARMNAVLEHGKYILGPEVDELESVLADYVGVSHCIAVSSGTDALLMALLALEIQPGDEVITSPFSFIASAETIALLGATPVFVDIDPETYNIDPARIETAITPATRAIIPVSLYGQCADIDAINAIAARHGLPVIEDAAQSFGATYHGRRSGGLSTIGCTSFFPSKPLGCYGDGGACFTNDEALARTLRQLRVHGQERRYYHTRIGVNGRMDTLQAAVLLAKMAVFPEEVTRRAELGAYYSKQLESIVQVPRIEPHNTSVYAQYTVQLDDRDTVMQALQAAGIPTAVHYPATLDQQPVFAYLNANRQACPQASRVADRVLSLPLHPYLASADQDRVIAAVHQACRG